MQCQAITKIQLETHSIALEVKNERSMNIMPTLKYVKPTFFQGRVFAKMAGAGCNGKDCDMMEKIVSMHKYPAYRTQ